MNPERWQKIEAIFQTAVDYEPNQRAGYLTQACSGDQELRAEVESLLAQELADTFMQAQIKGVAQLITAEPQDLVGKHVGVYRVASLIGEGGMGAVYAAVRVDQQFDQQVALKVVKRGMDSSFVLNRFRRERQILARLEHPHIARLIDGGTTSDGRPYFVMEFVEGQSITQYCTEQELSVVDRLKLFRQVCAAVQYAHQQLVVHRDLKPSNILVAIGGLPKLLDFGIAKVLQPDDSQAEATMTATSLRLMTPDYASPEQARGQSISAATDVYSLGVVLYELLTGERPHRFQSYTPTEIERVICEAEVARPSTAVTSSKTEGLAKWRKQLVGDLDNIVLMALRKEPERRYNSVEQFSEDLRRHLEGQPVIARQDTFGYRTGKFVRRHKLGVTATALVMLSLISGLGIANYQARRAERRFQQVRELANTFLFDFHDQVKDLPGSTKARELVVSTALKYLDSLSQEASGDAALEWELAQAYLKVADVQGDPWLPNLGHTAAAMQSYGKSLQLAQKLAKKDGGNLAVRRLLGLSYFKLGALQSETGDKTLAGATFRQGVGDAERLAQQTDDEKDVTLVEDFYARLGDTQLDTNDVAGALQSYRKSLQISERRALAHPSDRAQSAVSASHSHLGETLAVQGDLNGAMDNFRQAADITATLVRRQPASRFYRRELIVVYNWLGGLSGNPSVVNEGDRTKAEALYRQSLEIAESIAAADPKDAMAKNDLSGVYQKLGDVLTAEQPAQAIEFYRKALAIYHVLLADAPDDFRFQRRTANTLRRLAAPLRQKGDRPGALSSLNDAVEQLEKLAAQKPENIELNNDLQSALFARAGLLLETNDDAGAQADYRKALTLSDAEKSAQSTNVYALWRLADVNAGLGHFYATLANRSQASTEARLAAWDEARTWNQKALALWNQWSQQHESNIFIRNQQNQAARNFAQCENALARLQVTP